MMVLVEMMAWMMMIPMKPSLTMVLMATVSPLREGISPAEICLPERSFSIRVFRPQRRRKSICGRPLALGFRREDIGEEAESGSGQLGHTCPRRGPGGPAPRGWGPCGPSSLLLLASSIFWKNNIFPYFFGIFLIFAKLHRNAFFSIRIQTPAVHPPRIIQHA